MQRAIQKICILPPQRLIQPHFRDNFRALRLIGLGRDQDVHGVADHMHADEHDDRHGQQHKAGLEQAAEDPGEH